MSKEVITLPNLCPHVRIEIDGKAYRVFSIRYTHPKDSSENAWSLFTGTTEKPILIDKDTFSKDDIQLVKVTYICLVQIVIYIYIYIWYRS